jgi:multidrug efflux system membrane fusion protein
VNVRLLVDTLKQVIVVPVAAVQRGPNGAFVYVVDAESKAAVRAVTVGQQDDTSAVISDGLKADEKVVTSGFTRLSNGTRVRVQGADGQPAPADAAPAQKQSPDAAPGERRRKREGGSAENKDKEQRKSDASSDNSSAASTKQ